MLGSALRLRLPPVTWAAVPLSAGAGITAGTVGTTVGAAVGTEICPARA